MLKIILFFGRLTFTIYQFDLIDAVWLGSSVRICPVQADPYKNRIILKRVKIRQVYLSIGS